MSNLNEMFGPVLDHAAVTFIYFVVFVKHIHVDRHQSSVVVHKLNFL